MRKSLMLGWSLALFVGVFGLAAHAQPGIAGDRPNAVPDEVLVKFSPGIAEHVITQVHGRVGGKALRKFPHVGWQQVKLPPGMTVDRAVGRYRLMAEVAAVEPDYIYYASLTPNDSRYSSQWGLRKIQAPEAWNTTTGSAGVVVGVLDTGVSYTHQDLQNNIWRNPGEVAGNGIDDDGNGYVDDVYGWNFRGGNANPLDDNGHGSHVAGIIGAVGNNGLGVSGVNWSVKIMALKFLGSDGSGSTSGAVSAYNYAIAMKKRGVNIRVMNNSWGGAGYSQALKDAIDAAGNAGILSASAAGNGNSSGIGYSIDSTPQYPASYTSPSVIAVAASDSNDNPAKFTNFGTTSVDLAAPGVSVLSTLRGASSYGYMSGTSMATPFVSGAAALLAAKNPVIFIADIKSTLLSNVDRLTQWTGKVAAGGRLNLAKAIQSLGGTTPPPPVTTYQPDMLIRTSAGSLYIGDNIYGAGSIASVSQSIIAGGTAIYPLAVQNDGSGSDSFVINGTAGGSGWTVRYYNATSGGAEITSQVTGAGWSTGAMAAGATLQFRAEVVPASTVAGGSSYTIAGTAKSAGDATRTDTVRGVTTVQSSTTTTPITSVSLTANPLSPQYTNTAVTLMASAVGGPAEYKFIIGRRMIWYVTWTTLQDYSTSSAATWRPTAAGSYQVRVYARAVGSTASYQKYTTISYTIR
ncbi:MAG: S8 family peptidase [Armatimonadota bacterium]